VRLNDQVVTFEVIWGLLVADPIHLLVCVGNVDPRALTYLLACCMNLILEKSRYVESYTHLRALFDAVPQLRSYFYVISDLEVSGTKDPRLFGDVVRLSGEELHAMVRSEDMQFVWAVFSALEEPPARLPLELPSADGNPRFWEGSPKPQMPGASFEIVAFDASCTLFIGVDAALAARLRDLYQDIADLDQCNQQRARA